MRKLWGPEGGGEGDEGMEMDLAERWSQRFMQKAIPSVQSSAARTTPKGDAGKIQRG